MTPARWAPLYNALIREGWRPIFAHFTVLQVAEILK